MWELILLLLLCLLLALGSLGVVVWAIVRGEFSGLDGILQILVALFSAAIFSGVGLSLLRSEPIRALIQPRTAGASDGAKTAPPESPPRS